MSDVVIQVDDLWKKYRLGVLGTGTLRHDLNRWWHRIRGKSDPYAKVGAPSPGGEGRGEGERSQNQKTTGQQDNGPGSPVVRSPVVPPSALDDDELWALRGVSFEVKQGEILGIIGRNGAGKSTLLKILSRVTAPTRGEVRIKGRVASLLEVGTGFHPELTGRENIFLNGAILGMTKAEIKSKLDEIVAFAEIEKFLDTPVKRYSSGMYVRLAFAVAAHLEPEILIVDEVLAVGDAEFQKKCLGKMGEVSQNEGRTVLFVSHNLASVEAMCDQSVVLDGGETVFSGGVDQGIGVYLKSAKQLCPRGRYDRVRPTEKASILRAMVTGTDRNEASAYPIGAELEFTTECLAACALGGPKLGIGINDAHGLRVATLHSEYCGAMVIPRAEPGLLTFVCRPKNLALAPGIYRVKLSLENSYESLDVLDPAFEFEVAASDYYGGSAKLLSGVIHCGQEWKADFRNMS